MRDLNEIVNRNDQAVLRAHAEALGDGNLKKARAIEQANPDLFSCPERGVAEQPVTETECLGID